MPPPYTIAFIGIGNSPHVCRLAGFLAGRGHRVHVISEDGLAPFSEVAGVTFHTFKTDNGFAARVLEVSALLRRIKPDILHSHAINYGGYLGVASGFHPHVINAWGSDILLDPKRSLRHRIQTAVALRAADAVISDSGEQRQAAYDIGGKLSINRVMLWGIDTAHFAPEKQLPQSLQPFSVQLVLSPRLFRPLYNQDVMLEAWPAVLRDFPKAVLACVVYREDENFVSDTKRKIRQQGLEHSIKFIPPLSYDELPGAFANASAVLSIPSSDGTPLTVLEAMSSGGRVVASNLPALRDWIKPGENGLLVSPRKPAELAEAIKRLLGLGKKDCQEMASSARSTVLQRADREFCLSELEALYESLNGRRGFGYGRSARNFLGLSR